MLLLAFGAAEDGENGHTESMSDEMGCPNISSRKLSAAELLHHARMEWAVETMHWLLDVHYGEDYCRIENRTIQQNLNLLRKFSIILLKHVQGKNFIKKSDV